MNPKGSRVLAVALAAAGATGILYMRFIEPEWLKIRTVPIAIGTGRVPPSALRIVHLTDFHLSGDVSLGYLRSAFASAARQNPDLICLTGDYISKHIQEENAYVEALKQLSAAAPTFACPGNHDGGIWSRERGGYPTPREMASLLERAGVVFLENEAREIGIRGTRIAVAGLGDLWAGRCDPGALAEYLDTSGASLKILLSHNPDAKGKTRNLSWDLMLCGHTHGGQLILPVLGAPFAPVRDKSYLRGLYAYEGRQIHVSPGVGNLHGLRFNSRPEISILILE